MYFNTSRLRLTTSRREPASFFLSAARCLAPALALIFFLPATVRSAELAEAQKLFLTGEYEKAAREAREGMTRERRNDAWPILLSRSLLALGRYPEALTMMTNALEVLPFSVPLRVEAHEVFRRNGQTQRARSLLDEVNQLARAREWELNNPRSLVALGRAALWMGADPKLVLENFFNRARTLDATNRESYLAIGHLELEKNSFDLAARTFRDASGKFPNDPDMHYGLARAFVTGDRTKMGEAIEAALKINQNHVPSLLLQVDYLVDAEEYGEADKILERVFAVNPHDPEAWTYRAVLAHLRHQPEEERKARERALQFWKTDPRVDHLLGLKLSQKYRFAEGAACQRRALAADPEYLPAKLQLAQDLLRLGEEDEGWSLAKEVHEKDGYDVVAYNLTTLRDTIAGYVLVTNEVFSVRMTAAEAAIYGDRVLRLLNRARDTLAKKYDYHPPAPTRVEMFPEQKDFAIRTFALPGGEGFLAVCFGNVITANSPKSQPGVNWEAVLWHEFCHTITLGLTKNKMPRWLSEGISVFEEEQANPAWGQSMTPKYRELILDGKLTPVGKLSSAFMTAKTPLDMQFAYYQSGLVVEYLVGRHGMESLKSILRDLGEGREINAAIAAHTAPLAEVEKGFERFAKERAQKLGGELDWTKPAAGRAGLAAVADLHPQNYYRLTHESRAFLNQREWEKARAPLETLLRNYPEEIGADSPHALLARVHRALRETDQEWTILTNYVVLDAAAPGAYERLMELAAQRQDWPLVATNAERYLAVNPLVSIPHQFAALAAESTGENTRAVEAYRTLLRLDPPDPADVHFRLARLLRQLGDPAAKRHLLQSLEDAPRYREALRMLTELPREIPAPTNAPTLVP